jgi:hypothetical protein
MIYNKGDKVRIRNNYIMPNHSAAFQPLYEKRIQKLENRTVTINACFKKCSYDEHEPGYRFREFPRLVFRESMIECLMVDGGQGSIGTRFEILDL